jgi:hypothetical protein
MSKYFANQIFSQKILLMLDFLINDQSCIIFQNKFLKYQIIVSIMGWLNYF